MNVTAVIVTRGDVDLDPVLKNLPSEWSRLVYDNSKRRDLSVYGRYAALFEVDTPLCYVQDDDVIVSDPQAIVDAWEHGHVVCNMPQEFRPHYPDSALVGFGACFETYLPERAFGRYEHWLGDDDVSVLAMDKEQRDHFYRECDSLFTTLTPRILVDVPKTDRDFASDPDRLWKQPEHGEMRQRMLALARQVRDA